MGRNRDSIDRGTEVGEMTDGAHSTPAIVIPVLAGLYRAFDKGRATCQLGTDFLAMDYLLAIGLNAYNHAFS